MENIELLKLINRIQHDLIKNGIVVDKVVQDLKKLRGFFIEEQLPRVVKIVRLAYEHVEKYKSFNIAIPEDEGSDSEVELSPDELRVESLNYFLSLLQKPTQKLNAEDLDYYLNSFTNYSKNH